MDDVIFSYTAKQAVEDGVLFDVTETASELFKVGCDMKWSYRISVNVKQLCTPPKSNKIESFEGRLWDLLNVGRMAIRGADKNDNMVEFTCKFGKKNHRIWATLDTTSGPAIHFITPEEY